MHLRPHHAQQMNKKIQIDEFWQSYLDAQNPALSDPSATYEAWSFGNTPEIADELGALVVQGIKTATASLVCAYEHAGERYPQIGDFSIILDGRRKPICIIEVIDVQIQPFVEIGERHAFEEGEGDRTLAYWRKVHRNFLRRNVSLLAKSPAAQCQLSVNDLG